MKHSPRSSRTPSNLSDSIHRQLNAYALAASAAGVSLLALTQSADAKIVYTKAHRSILPKTHYDLDLNHDGIADFTLSNFATGGGQTHANGLRILMRNGSARGYMSHETCNNCGWFGASNLRAGAEIVASGASKKFMSRSLLLAFSLTGVSGYYGGGQWKQATNGYLGLKFVIKGKTHYGWARLSTSCHNFTCTELLTGYAYESIPNKPIIAGKTHSADDSSVVHANTAHRGATESTSLGRLAQGFNAPR